MKCDKYLTVVPLTRRDSRPLSDWFSAIEVIPMVDANPFMASV